MSKSLEKRRSLLAHTRRDHEELHAKLITLTSVPEGVLRDWYRIDDRFGRAEDLVDSPEGEFEVDRAVSLHIAFTKSDALVGLAVRSGGWKDKVRDEQQAEHQRWATSARELLAKKKKPLQHGFKTEISRAVAGKYGVKFDTVRTRLRKMGVWEQV